MSKVSIVVPTLNEEKNIGNLLDDLYRDRKSIKEIVVVDGHSQDRTQEIVKKHKTKILPLYGAENTQRCLYINQKRG